MPRKKSFTWHDALRAVMQNADPWALKYVEPAFNGDSDAAFSLAAALGNAKRGTAGVSMRVARAGYSWTLNRDMACWFAMRFSDLRQKPLVLSAEVPRGEIALYGNERGEAEVVLMRAPAASVDGTSDEWQRRFDVVEAVRRVADRPQRE
jgi:hypothetical protein